VSLVQLWVLQLKLVVVILAFSKLMEVVHHAQPNVQLVKLMEYVALVLIQIENYNKIVIALLACMMMELLNVKHVILFVKLVLQQLLVLHVSLKTTEL
jgi:hypothetical protein